MPSMHSTAVKLLAPFKKDTPPTAPLFGPVHPSLGTVQEDFTNPRRPPCKKARLVTVTHDNRLPLNIALNLSTKAFRGEVLTLLRDWHDLTTYLGYRHMVAYYNGLGEWRRHNYRPDSVPFPDGSRCSLPHRICQELRGQIGRIRAADKTYYDIQCASYRHEQRKHKAAFFKQWRNIEFRYIQRLGPKEIRNMQQWARGRGFLEVIELFDDNMEVPEDLERLEAKCNPERGGDLFR